MAPAIKPIITFTSDYGTRDEFVGSVKGVIAGLCPAAVIIDISHDISPQSIDEAAWLLASAYASFPDGTIHLAVVDPGVGGPRRAIAARTTRGFWVGPDNGLFTIVFDRDGPATVIEIDRQRFFQPVRRWGARGGEEHLPPLMRAPYGASGTFDGRDLFAPVAARLACGSPLTLFGPPVLDWVRLPVSQPEIVTAAPRTRGTGDARSKRRRGAGSMGNSRIDGAVIRVDRFGNLITNISIEQLGPLIAHRTPEQVAVFIGSRRLLLYRYYEEAVAGTVGALINSSGLLEIFASRASARQELGVGTESSVRIEIV
jgi:S-adenosylmethionine hydrolase